MSVHSIKTHTHTNTLTFNGPLSGITRVSRYQNGKINLDFTEARDSEWQWHQLGHMQVCTSLQRDNYTSTPPLSFLQAGCPSCRPTNSVHCCCCYPQSIGAHSHNTDDYSNKNMHWRHRSKHVMAIQIDNKVKHPLTFVVACSNALQCAWRKHWLSSLTN